MRSRRDRLANGPEHGVLFLHHTHREASAAGQIARGSGALSGHLDVLLERQTVDNTPGAWRLNLAGIGRRGRGWTDSAVRSVLPTGRRPRRDAVTPQADVGGEIVYIRLTWTTPAAGILGSFPMSRGK